MKLVIIGAGSMSFSPSLLNSITRAPALANCELGLVDVDAQALEIIERLARRVAKERGLGLKVKASADRRDVLAGADVVTTTIAVGGMEAFRLDIDIPARHGCIQPVGDTSGPGGLGRALRHIPELVAIAEDMADLCPKATLYNYTNPLSVLTRAVIKHTPIECLGLCIGPEMTWHYLADFLGVDHSDTWALIAGINHCHWVLELRRGAEDLRPQIAARLAQYKSANEASQSGKEVPYTDPFKGRFQPFSFSLYERFGYFPGPGDMHVAEFFPQLLHQPGRAESMGMSNGHVVAHQERSQPGFFEAIRQQAFEEVPLSEEMFGEHSYGEETQLTAILHARRGHKPMHMFVNVPNRGVIPNLPDEAVVEVPCLINAAGVLPIYVGPLPSSLAATIARAVANIEVTIEAALSGSRELAVQAYLSDPYCTDIVSGPDLVNQLIDGLWRWLPLFRSRGCAEHGLSEGVAR